MTNSEELGDGLGGSDEDRALEYETEGTDYENEDEGVTGNTAKAILSGKRKLSREKMREMLDKRRNKKLTKIEKQKSTTLSCKRKDFLT